MIARFSQLFRLIHINFVLARHGLDNLIVTLHLFRPFRFMVWLNPWNWCRPHPFNPGVALRQSLEDLGPIFIKFGQALSIRRDLIPDDIADELTKLQDQVPPFPSEEAIRVIETTYGKPISQLFAEFDPVPLASASIAQVHTATLFDGRKVVVKIVRPKIENQIRRDIGLLYLIAKLALRYWSDAPRFHPVEIVQEFEQTIMDELDLMVEAANAALLRRHFEDSHLLYVPEIIWSLARSRVMVMERIYGIPILDLPALVAAGVDIKKLAHRGVEIFFTQVFRDSFFHADMHPGNIFVSIENPKDPKYICVDFGIMGTLDHKDKQYLAENFHAFFQRDYNRVAELHVESGWVAPSTRITDFERAIRTVCEPIFERPLSDISCAQLLMKLFQIGRRFQMEIQPQLLLLQKTLFAIEGLGRILYPELDLWTTAKPFLERWIKEQIGVKAFFKRIKNQLPYWSEQLPLIPTLIHDKLLAEKQLATQDLYQRQRSHATKDIPLSELKTLRRKTIGYTLGLVGILEFGFIYYFNIDNVLVKQLSYVFMASGLLTTLYYGAKQR